VVVGDGKGRVGIGYGKANGVPNAVEKGVKDARKNMFRVPILEGTIPHEIKGQYSASQAFLAPASPGTGIIAGASVRAVVEAAGVKNILTKSFGSTNPINLVKATELALKSLRTRRDVEKLRGVSLDERAGTWHTKESAVRKGGLGSGTPAAAAPAAGAES
jgi:small subunit ribosomal protein S5